MTSSSTELNFDFITDEQITALKRLIHIGLAGRIASYQDHALARLNETLNKEYISNFDDLDDFMSQVDTDFSISTYEFEWRELESLFLNYVSGFARRHGLDIDLDNILSDTDDVASVFIGVNDQLDTIGFNLIMWDKGCDFYTLLLVRNDDVNEALDIGKLLSLTFQHVPVGY